MLLTAIAGSGNMTLRNATMCGGDQMLNVDKVRGRMAEMRLTQKDVATALGVAVPTASQKLNRVRPMDLDEAEKLATLLGLEDSQFGEYFFAG
jgi:transcriptional regulator with XRE-family HTH domain